MMIKLIGRKFCDLTQVFWGVVPEAGHWPLLITGRTAESSPSESPLAPKGCKWAHAWAPQQARALSDGMRALMHVSRRSGLHARKDSFIASSSQLTCTK